MSAPVVLAVAGTDSGGAAGLSADLATIGHLGCHAACVVTAVTAQNSTGVRAIHPVPPPVVAAQIDAVLDDLPVAVVKTGMLGSAEVVGLVADRLAHLPLVVDPVLVATSGAVLGDDAVRRAYGRDLLPVARLVTPNLDEARALTDRPDDDAPELAARLAETGCNVVVTGGPQWQPGQVAAECLDWWCEPGGRPRALVHPAVATTADHGTGCTFASAVAAALAASYSCVPNSPQDPGPPPDGPTSAALRSACLRAADYVARQLAVSHSLGRGRGPISHIPPQEEPA